MDMSCRAAMLRMHRDGLIALPPPRNGNRNGWTRPGLTGASDPREPLTLGEGALAEIVLRPVDTPKASSLWKERIERYHYLGQKPLAGAQIRYLARRDADPLATLGFEAAAWKVAPRDRFIGWTHPERERNLHRIVNNARFLILPGSGPGTWLPGSFRRSPSGCPRIGKPATATGRCSWRPSSNGIDPRDLLPGGELDPRRANPGAGEARPQEATPPSCEGGSPLPPHKRFREILRSGK